MDYTNFKYNFNEPTIEDDIIDTIYPKVKSYTPTLTDQ
jgi:hypothetical protein